MDVLDNKTINKLIIMYKGISPWARRVYRAPPTRTFKSGIILFRGPPWLIFYMLPRKKLGCTIHFRRFSRWLPAKLTFSSISL